ncbi:NADH:flavin oxidoreductase [Lentisphaerota bacterium WC36G]|nr:NADH:flavin oxidoreductase [Lentisphaerae bacterium WC36]
MGLDRYKKVSSLKTVEDFREHVKSLGVNLPVDDTVQSGADAPMAQKLEYKGRTIGNRWSILPMEGWDCLGNGAPSELTERRWVRFGQSGAKLLYGCEAAAVMKSGKSNTRQMMMTPETVEAMADLRQKVVNAHGDKFGETNDLYVGLQLTHSGRFSHPNDDKVLESTIAYNHPLLDVKFGNQNTKPVTDEEVEVIVKKFIDAAELSYQAGYQFVDIKHAHGYLGHEFLSAFDRPGKYGGSFENRTRFFREIASGIKKRCPDLDISLRLSLFDMMPFKKAEDGHGEPMIEVGDYKYAFGGDGTGGGIDMTETIKFLQMIRDEFDVRMVCTTVGSPYYIPHIQRPAYYPVSDGYMMPEDPLVGVARQINAVAEVKKACPDMHFVGSGLTYLQEWLPNVAQSIVASGMQDFAGIGRMVLSYPEICADSLAGKPLNRRLICRTFGDCTTAPRNGLVSGCYPLDLYYKKMTDYVKLQEIKRQCKACK